MTNTTESSVQNNARASTSATKKQSRVKRVPELLLDGGSSRTKFYLDKVSDAYQSVVRIFPKTHELPSGFLGVFRIGDKGYAVGDSASALSGGVVEEGYANDNKIKMLHVWVIGALCIHPCFLHKRTKKQKTGVIEIDLKLSLLSLSSHRKKEIEKAFSSLQFEFDDREFKITIVEYVLYPEGYGAACEAKRHLKAAKSKDKKFHILDLGGGTLTHTPYSNLNSVPRACSQKSISGAGIVAITELFAKESPKGGDTGGNIYYLSRLKEALESSRVLNEAYSSEIILGDETKELGDKLRSALEAWTRELIGVREVLRDVRQLIRKGEPVFLTGGGFKIETVSHFVQEYLGGSKLVAVLDNPEDVNITGIKS